jgi:putative oxidoreductase
MTNGEAWGALLLRVVLGVVYASHGYLAYTVMGPRGTAAFVFKLGFPASLAEPLAWFLIAAHTVGGAMMIVGLFTRIVALINVPIMLTAIFVIYLPQGYFMKGALEQASGKPVAIGYEYPLLILGATLAMVLLGSGKLALDGLFHRPPRRRRH